VCHDKKRSGEEGRTLRACGGWAGREPLDSGKWLPFSFECCRINDWCLPLSRGTDKSSVLNSCPLIVLSSLIAHASAGSSMPSTGVIATGSMQSCMALWCVAQSSGKILLMVSTQRKNAYTSYHDRQITKISVHDPHLQSFPSIPLSSPCQLKTGINTRKR
jgi:hypothetical protein